jgi:simple sugar transport system permease protein
MAGAVQILAVNRSMAVGLSSGAGFDSIALALLGNSTPIGVVMSSLFFGAMRNGATRMELLRIPNDIISIIQALILAFVAAPAIIRTIYRIRVPKEAEEAVFVGGSWGGGK